MASTLGTVEPTVPRSGVARAGRPCRRAPGPVDRVSVALSTVGPIDERRQAHVCSASPFPVPVVSQRGVVPAAPDQHAGRCDEGAGQGYYADPDKNRVELQVDCFGDWSLSKAWMATSEDFHADPLGAVVDPAKVAEDWAAGRTFEEIHATARSGGYVPDAA
jgi:hypothetical protein